MLVRGNVGLQVLCGAGTLWRERVERRDDDQTTVRKPVTTKTGTPNGSIMLTANLSLRFDSLFGNEVMGFTPDVVDHFRQFVTKRGGETNIQWDLVGFWFTTLGSLRPLVPVKVTTADKSVGHSRVNKVH